MCVWLGICNEYLNRKICVNVMEMGHVKRDTGASCVTTAQVVFSEKSVRQLLSIGFEQAA